MGNKLTPGTNKAEKDRVMTPDDLAVRVVKHFRSQTSGVVLEPCAGMGAFVRALNAEGITPIELELERGQDFFNFHDKVDWIITNPPWSKVRAFSKHAYEVADNIVFLLPVPSGFGLTRRWLNMVEAGFGIKEIAVVYPAPPKEVWPQSGFLLCAMHFQRGWQGTPGIGVTNIVTNITNL